MILESELYDEVYALLKDKGIAMDKLPILNKLWIDKIPKAPGEDRDKYLKEGIDSIVGLMRVYPSTKRNTKDYVLEYFKLNRIFKPTTYVINGEEVVA